MTDSMTKFKNRMSAEESVSNFISYLEESGSVLSDKNKDWLYTKGTRYVGKDVCSHYIN